MAATALIKLTQGVTVGSGQAISGAAGSPVTIENVDNTDVASWKIDLLDAPSNSALVPGTLAQGNSSTPSATLNPDVVGGSYRIRLIVWPQTGQQGTPDVDIRNFVAPDQAGLVTPPSQIWPQPLPPLPSGSSGAKPNEMNLSGNERGWAGLGSNDGLLDQRFRYPRQADAVRETGGAVLVAGAIADGQVLRRVGTQLVGTAFGVGGVALSAGTASASSGTVVFSNSNGMSFGMSGSTVTGSYTVPSTAGLISGVDVSAGTTSSKLASVVFSNSNGVSFGISGSTITASVPAQSVQPGIAAASAGTQTATTGTLKFVDGNGISFGLGSGANSNQLTASYTVPTVPPQTNQTVGLYALGNTTGQSSSTTVDARTLSVSGAGVASVGMSAGELVVSVPAATQSTAPAAISAGTTQATDGTVVFSNSNGVSFGMSGRTVTATVNPGAAAGIAALAAGTQTATSGTVAFVDSNGVTFGMSGSTRVTASVAAQSNQTGGIYAGGNTTGQSSSSTHDARTLSVNGDGIISVGWSNSTLRISATQSAQTQNVVVPSAGTQTATSGTVVWANSNGISFGMSGSSQVTASYTVPAVPAQLSVGASTGGNTIGDTGVFTGRVVLAGGNNITLSGSSNAGSVTITISAPNAVAQTNQTEGVYLAGNTTGQSSSSTHDARSFSINGDGIISVGWSASTLRISATQSAQTQNVVVPSAGTQTATSGTVVWANSNGISFGMSGSSQVTASYTVPTVPAQLSVGLSNVGNTSGDTVVITGRLVLAGGNNITVSGSSNAGSMTVTISAPNAVAQTNQTIGFYALGNTTQNSSTTLDARTVSLNGLGIVTVGYSNGSVQISATQSVQTAGIYAGGNTTGQSSSSTHDARTLSVNGDGIISVGWSNSTLRISATQSNQTVGLYAVSNTTQGTSGTVDARTLSFAGAGIASVGITNGSVVISVPSGGGAGDGYNIIAAGTQTANTTGTVVFSNSNGVSFGLSNSSVVTASVSNQTEGWYVVPSGATTHNSSTTFDPRTISISLAGAFTGGFSNGSIELSVPSLSSLSGVGGISISTNGSTISISGPNVNHFEPFPMLQSGSTTYAPGAGTWHVDPFFLPANISGGRLNFLVSFNSMSSAGGILVPTSSASFGAGTTGSRSISYSYVKQVALYSLGAGTNSTRLESFWSNTYSVGINHSVSVSSNGATSLSVTNAATMSYVASIDASGNYTTTTLASSTQRTTNVSTMNSSGVSAALSSLANILSGQFALPVGFNTTLTPGNYWLAQAWTSASTTGGTAGQAFSFVNQQAMYGISSMPWRVWGATASSTGSQIFPGQGIYSAASASPPATVAFSDIRSTASHLKNYFNFVNSTI